MRIGITFTDIDLLGKRLSLADAKALLSPLNQIEALRFCAFLSAMNETGLGPGIAWNIPVDGQRLRALLHDLLPAVHHAKALRLAASPRPFVPLVTSALRALIKLACQWCPPQGGKNLENIRYRQNVAKVLFGLQGALVDRRPIGNADLNWIYEVFPGMTRYVMSNARLHMSRDIGRLYGIVSRPAIGALLEQRQGGMTVDAWFNRECGISGRTYWKIAQALTGYAGRFTARLENLNELWLDLVAFQKFFPGSEQQVWRILQLAVSTVGEVAGSQNVSDGTTLSDVVYDPNDILVVRPLLRVGDRYLVTSFDAVFSKFVRGFPYLAHAAAQNAGVTGDRLHKGARNPTGLIFEGYARWLTREWFRESDVKVFCGYQMDIEHARKEKMEAERDVLVVVGDLAFPIEVKAKVPTLAARASGDVISLTTLISHLSLQATTAADALVSGKCRSEDGTPLPGIRKAYPCVLIFERFPVRFPLSDAFEAELRKKLNRAPFKDSSTVGPLQIFDIDSYEEWDMAFHLPSEIGLLTRALQKRATTPELRYKSLCEIRNGEDGLQPSWKSVLDTLCDESEAELTASAGVHP